MLNYQSLILTRHILYVLCIHKCRVGWCAGSDRRATEYWPRCRCLHSPLSTLHSPPVAAPRRLTSDLLRQQRGGSLSSGGWVLTIGLGCVQPLTKYTILLWAFSRRHWANFPAEIPSFHYTETGQNLALLFVSLWTRTRSCSCLRLDGMLSQRKHYSDFSIILLKPIMSDNK